MPEVCEDSFLSVEVLALIDRVIVALAAFAEEGLSPAATEILIGLGYWRPMSLAVDCWRDDFYSRIAALGCGSKLWAELKRFCADYCWPD